MKKNLNKNVIKAISIGLSATMMMQPIAALANELDENNVTPVTEELAEGKEEVAKEKDIMEEIADADAALDEAEAKEGKVAKEALVIIGSGIVTDETLAIIADTKAENHVENGKQEIIEGEQNVADQLSDYYDNKDAVDAESADLDNVVDRAVALFDNASFYAEAGKSENWQSGIADMYADQALPSVEALESLAATAGKDAKEAADAYADLKAQYEEAVRLANEATEAANEEFAKGGKAADWAVKEARDAVAKANALRIATWTTAQAAGWNLSFAQFIYDGAKDNLEEATKNLAAATLDVVDEAGDVLVAKAALNSAGVLLDAAKGIEGLAKANVEAKEQAIENLTSAKRQAEADMSSLKQQLDGLNSELAQLEKEIEGYEANGRMEYVKDAPWWNRWQWITDHIGGLQDAYDAAASAYSDAQSILEGLQTEKDGLDNDVTSATTDLNESGSPELIALEKKLREASEDEKAGVIDEIIAQVITENLADGGEVSKVNGETNVFSVVKDNETKFYIAEVNEDGSVSIFESTSERKRGEQKGDSENLATLDGVEGTEGIDYTAVYHEAVAGTPAKEATYDFDYKVPGSESTYDKGVGEFLKHRPSDFENVSKIKCYTKVYNNYVYVGDAYIWHGTWYVNDGIVWDSKLTPDYVKKIVVVTNETTGRATNVKESDLKNYSNITNKTVNTPAVAAVPGTPAYYTVTYYDSYVQYNYADQDSDADNSAVVNKYDSYESAVQAAAEKAQEIENQQSTVRETKTAMETASENLEAAKDERTRKQTAYNLAKEKYDELVDYYRTRKLKNLGFTDYEVDLAEAELELGQAELALAAAEEGVRLAQGIYNAAEREYNKQLGELKVAVNAWIDAVAAEGRAAAIFAGASINLADAKAKYAAAMAADQYAALLQEDAIAAKEAAKEARDLVKKLKANVAAGDLAAALKALEEAEAKMKEAQEAANTAAKYAKDARQAYEDARSKARKLAIDEYYRNQGEETEEVVAVVNAPVVRRVAAVAPVVEEVEEEVEEEEEVIEVVEEETPLAEEPVVIEEEETPLATMEEQAKMSWWWMLIVLAFGGAGAEIYRRHLVKKNADKLGK